MMRKYILVLILAFFCLPVLLFAEECNYDYQIKYDKDGKIQEVITQSINIDTNADSGQTNAAVVQPAEEEARVKIYTLPTDMICVQAKAYLTKLGVKYKEILVSNQDGLDEMIKVSGQQNVPVIVIGDEVLLGFNRGKVNQALGIAEE